MISETATAWCSTCGEEAALVENHVYLCRHGHAFHLTPEMIEARRMADEGCMEYTPERYGLGAFYGLRVAVAFVLGCVLAVTITSAFVPFLLRLAEAVTR